MHGTIAIVAGEQSGDELGAGLILALKQRYPHLHFCGVAGRKMQAAGCQTLFPMQDIAVMGLLEILKHLPRLLQRRRQVREYFKAHPPLAYIGVDAPEFNLHVAMALKQTGVPTVQYTSPSVWAWRKKRLRKIARAIDLMLCLLPFETTIYAPTSVHAQFVGHPMADAIPLTIDKAQARQALGIASEQTTLALLPGSRDQEIHYMAETLLRAAALCARKLPRLQCIVPLARAQHEQIFNQLKQRIAPTLDCYVQVGVARQALLASDAAIVTSGTATLEAMLCQCPMVIAYKMSGLTYQLAKRLVKVPFIGLPNLLAGRQVVPELIQEAATPEALAQALLALLGEGRAQLCEIFNALHRQLQQDTNNTAARGVVDLIQRDIENHNPSGKPQGINFIN